MSEYFNDIVRQKPNVYVKIQCSHEKTYVDSRGNQHQSTVVTYTGSKQFFFKSWRDTSDCLKIPRPGSKMLRIKVEKGFTFADGASRVTFNQFKDDYIRENRSRDTNITHSIKLKIPGFKKRLTGSNTKPPYWMSLPYFFLAHLLLLGWPYRWLLKSRTDKAEFKVEKEISIFEHGVNPAVPTLSTTISEPSIPNEDLAYPSNHGFGFKLPHKSLVDISERNGKCE